MREITWKACMGGISQGTFLGKHAWEMVPQGCWWENMSRKKIPRKFLKKTSMQRKSQGIISRNYKFALHLLWFYCIWIIIRLFGLWPFSCARHALKIQLSSFASCTFVEHGSNILWRILLTLWFIPMFSNQWEMSCN